MSRVASSCSEGISCLYALTPRKTWSVPIYIKWRGRPRGRRDPLKTCDPGLSNGKLVTSPRPDGLSEGVSSEALLAGQAHTQDCVSHGSHQGLATDNEHVRKQKGCLRDVTEG